MEIHSKVLQKLQNKQKRKRYTFLNSPKRGQAAYVLEALLTTVSQYFELTFGRPLYSKPDAPLQSAIFALLLRVLRNFPRSLLVF
jgi:hypothetical protein